MVDEQTEYTLKYITGKTGGYGLTSKSNGVSVRVLVKILAANNFEGF